VITPPPAGTSGFDAGLLVGVEEVGPGHPFAGDEVSLEIGVEEGFASDEAGLEIGVEEGYVSDEAGLEIGVEEIEE
jgi:hypothetical protein